MESVDKDLDVRSKWLGIRNLKTPYKPIPYCLKSEENGRKINIAKKIKQRQRQNT